MRLDSRLAADAHRHITSPDVDGGVTAVRAPAAESLLQPRMRDQSLALAQGLAQDQIAFGPMVLIVSGSHQNISGSPRSDSFQGQQAAFDIWLGQTASVFSKESGQRFQRFHSASRNTQA